MWKFLWMTSFCFLLDAYPEDDVLGGSFLSLRDGEDNSKDTLAKSSAPTPHKSNTEELPIGDKLFRLVIQNSTKGDPNLTIDIDTRSIRTNDNITIMDVGSREPRNTTVAELQDIVARQTVLERTANVTINFQHTQKQYLQLKNRLSQYEKASNKRWLRAHVKRAHATRSMSAMQPLSTASGSMPWVPPCLRVIKSGRALWLLVVFSCVTATATPIPYWHTVGWATGMLTATTIVNSIIGILSIIMPFVLRWANGNACASAPSALALYILNSSLLTVLLKILGEIAMIPSDEWPHTPIRGDNIGIASVRGRELLPQVHLRGGSDTAFSAFETSGQPRSQPLEILLHRCNAVEIPNRLDSAPT